jgi:hypothetical protein
MMQAARNSETSDNIKLRTRQYIPEDSELYTRRRENFESHIANVFVAQCCLQADKPLRRWK